VEWALDRLWCSDPDGVVDPATGAFGVRRKAIAPYVGEVDVEWVTGTQTAGEDEGDRYDADD
jgi:hypothetical protein